MVFKMEVFNLSQEEMAYLAEQYSDTTARVSIVGEVFVIEDSGDFEHVMLNYPKAAQFKDYSLYITKGGVSDVKKEET